MYALALTSLILGFGSFALAKVEIKMEGRQECLKGKLDRVILVQSNMNRHPEVHAVVKDSQNSTGTLIYSGDSALGGMSLAAATGKSAVICKNGTLQIQ